MVRRSSQALRIRSHRYQQDLQGRYHLPPLRGAVVEAVVVVAEVQVDLRQIGK